MSSEKPGAGSQPAVSPKPEREREGRLRPGRARYINTAAPRLAGTTARLLRLSRQVSTITRQTSKTQQRESFSRQFNRRAIVNVRYSPGRMRGGWRAHGKYLERESAAGESGRQVADRLGLAENEALGTLAAGWQAAGDPRIFKVVISPEDGDRADFRQVANDVMCSLEQHVGSKLQWAGVVHRNTEHPHVHLIVRGIRADGTGFAIPRSVVKTHLREAVQRSLTRQLGLRTWDDIRRERDAEPSAYRVTSLDRAMGRTLPKDALEIVPIEPQNPLQERRLDTLRKMGLASQINGRWEIRSDFQNQLQRMKDLQDRARTLFQSGVAVSDPHAPMEYLDSSRKLIGRVLLTSEDERSGSLQTAFESIDGKIVIMKHDSTLRGAWVRGDLKAGNVVSIDSLRSDPNILYAAALSDYKTLLRDGKALDSLAMRIRNMSLLMTENDSGWMGELSKALAARARENEAEL